MNTRNAYWAPGLLQFQMHIRPSHFFFFIFDSYCSGSELPFYRFHIVLRRFMGSGGEGEKNIFYKKNLETRKVTEKGTKKGDKSCHKYWSRLDTCLEN